MGGATSPPPPTQTVLANTCPPDNVVNSRQIFANTNLAVAELLEPMLTVTFVELNAAHSIQDIMTKCGGKCMTMLLKFMESTGSHTHTVVHRSLKAPLKRDVAYTNKLNSAVSNDVAQFMPKFDSCLKSVKVNIPKDKLKKVQNVIYASSVNATRIEIANANANEKSLQQTVVTPRKTGNNGNSAIRPVPQANTGNRANSKNKPKAATAKKKQPAKKNAGTQRAQPARKQPAKKAAPKKKSGRQATTARKTTARN